MPGFGCYNQASDPMTACDPSQTLAAGDVVSGLGRIRNGRFGVSNGDNQTFVLENCRRQVARSGAGPPRPCRA